MITYAQISIDNRVVGISQLSDKVESENSIDITELEKQPQLGFIYDPSTGQFTEPDSEPIPPPKPSLDERMNQLQQDNLILMDALAVTFEELLNIKSQLGGTS